MRLLIIEDDEQLANLIRRSFNEEGYVVDVADTGVSGETLASSIPYDAIILDIMLPDVDGFEICKRLRQKNIHARILILTAKSSIKDKVKGLDFGADDYLIKSFEFEELSARIRSLLRRNYNTDTPVIKIGELSLNTITRELKRGEIFIDLTNKEFCLLWYMMSNPNAVITRRMMENHCWDLTLNSESNLIDVYIQRIRKKIDSGETPSMIETIRGAGYILKNR